jgi:hypothetical protein
LLDPFVGGLQGYSSRFRNYASERDIEDELDPIIAHQVLWKGECAHQIQACEVDGGLKLYIGSGDWVEEISYRGDYCIVWEPESLVDES